MNKNEFEIFFKGYFPRIYNFIYYRVRSRESAEDIVGRVFEKILGKGQITDEKGNLDAYVFTIARNEVNDYFRRQKVRAWITLDFFEDTKSDGRALLEDELVARENLAGLKNAMQLLDEREQNIIGLKFGAEMTNRDIAKVVELTESNVGIILYRAIGKLRDNLTSNKG